MSKHLKHIGVISFLTVVSRFLGLVRDALQLAIFGTTALMSSFNTAFILPNLFRRLLAEGSMTAAFIPTLQEELHHHGEPGAFALLSKVGSWLLLVSGGLAGVAMLVFSQSRLFPLEPKWYLAADLTVWLFPYLALISLAAAFSATLNVLQHFTEPALSPIWLNLAMILSLGGAGLHFAHTPLGEMHWLCTGVLVGGFFQMAVPGAVLLRLGWRPRFDLALSPRVREIARLMTPGLFGTAIYQINFSVSRLLAFSLDDSSATYLYTVNRLMEFPLGVFAVAVSTVVYPLIARHAVQGNAAGLAEDFRKGIRLILIINIPAGAGLALLSGPLVSFLYEHGRVTHGAAHAMGLLLAVMVIGLPFFSVASLSVRTFYAVKDMATPVKIAGIDFLVNIALTLTLIPWLGVVGIALASTTAIIVQTLLLGRAMTRRFPGMHLASLLPTIGKVVLGTAGMAVAVGGGWWAVRSLGLRPKLADAVAVFALVPTGVAVYAVLLWLLRIEGREELAAVLQRLRGRFGAPKPAAS